MDKNIVKTAPLDERTYDSFNAEFFAYSIFPTSIVEKLYIKKPSKNDTIINRKVLSREQNQLISQAINNEYLSSFVSNRYSLFDISFRKTDHANTVGFSYNDLKDYEYITPSEIFKHFERLGIDTFLTTIQSVQSIMFSNIPQYNPVSMIGFVIKDGTLDCIKAYIRFAREEVPTRKLRLKMIEKISKTITHQSHSNVAFLSAVEKIERLGVEYSFLGVDYNIVEKKERFKLYFRAFDHLEKRKVVNEIVALFPDIISNVQIQTMFQRSERILWGIALSTNAFDCVNGVQLYLYP